MLNRLTIVALLLALSTIQPALAADEPATPAPVKPAAPAITLKVGDAAPPLVLGTWFKGEAITELKKGEIYIIECWATWCGPCITAIPHVTELQQKYAKQNVTVIGVCVWDAADDEKVKAFVDKQGDKMNYRVVREQAEPKERQGVIATTWLKPAGRNGIPCSFVVDKEGKIAWIGHPMRLDSVMPRIVEGKFDAVKEAETDAKVTALQAQLNTAFRAKAWDDCLKLVDEIAAVQPDMASSYETTRLSILSNKGDTKAVTALATKWLEEAKGEGDIRKLYSAASLLSRPGAGRDLDLALKAAGRAAELSKREDAMILSVLATVQFEKGLTEQGNKTIEEAIGKATSEAMKKRFADIQAKYQKAEKAEEKKVEEKKTE